MKKLVGLWLLLGVGLLGCAKTTAATLADVLAKEVSGKKLLYYREGDFTDSGKKEVVAFFEDPKKRFDPAAPAKIDLVSVFVMDGSKVVKAYPLQEVWSLGYNDFALKTIKSFSAYGGAWNGYCFIDDFNGNGRDDVLFFTLGGNMLSVRVFEFLQGRFEPILLYPGKSSLSKITYDKDSRQFALYDSGGEAVPEGSRIRYELRWSPATQRYELATKSTQAWYDPKTGKVLGD